MPQRVSRLALAVAISGAGSLRVTRAQFSAMLSDRTKPVRVTREQVQSVYGDRTKPVRVSYLHTQILRTITDAPPVIPDEPPQVLDQREYNPYRPTLPNEVESVSPVLYDFMRENTDITRSQHNLTQAGDSTFPWELLTKLGPEQQFTLGSLGRFYHDDFGIILARYCQFTQIKPGPWIHGPVGFLRSDAVVSWRVTNNPALSSANLVAGIMGAIRSPAEGEYGWVLTQGANHMPLQLQPVSEFKQNQELIWGGFEAVAGQGIGRVLGRVRGLPRYVHQYQTQFDVGTVFLDLEGPSVDSLRAIFGDDFEGIRAELVKVQAILDKIDIDDLNAALDLIREKLTGQSESLELLGGLSRDLNDIRARLNALEQFNTDDGLYRRIMASINTQFEVINSYLEGLDGRDYSSAINEIRETLAALGEQISDVELQSQIQLVPLVTGEIPPKFVYLPDGGLVLVEIKR